MTILSAAQQACPARQVCGLTRDCFAQFVRRLTTKELVFLRFVAPQDARVNGKKRDSRIGKTPRSLVSNGIVKMIILLANALCAHDSIRSFPRFRLVENFP